VTGYIGLFLKVLLIVIGVISAVNIFNMMRVNLIFEDRQTEAKSAKLVRCIRQKTGKGGLLSSYRGVYSCELKEGRGEFLSMNLYGREKDVPAAVKVIPMKEGGVLERMDVWTCVFHKFIPLWIGAAFFSLLVLQLIQR